MPRARRAVLAVVALLAGACGGGSDAGGPDPVAKAEDPGAVLVNSRYPELPVEGLRTSYLLDTGLHLTPSATWSSCPTGRRCLDGPAVGPIFTLG